MCAGWSVWKEIDRAVQDDLAHVVNDEGEHPDPHDVVELEGARRRVPPHLRRRTSAIALRSAPCTPVRSARPAGGRSVLPPSGSRSSRAASIDSGCAAPSTDRRTPSTRCRVSPRPAPRRGGPDAPAAPRLPVWLSPPAPAGAAAAGLLQPQSRCRSAGSSGFQSASGQHAFERNVLDEVHRGARRVDSSPEAGPSGRKSFWSQGRTQPIRLQSPRPKAR